MSVIVINDWQRLKAGAAAVQVRARAVGADADKLRQALHVLLWSLQQGGSTGVSVALANSTFKAKKRRPA